MRKDAKSEIVLMEIEKISEENKDTYVHMMTDGVCEIIIMSKLGAIKDVLCSIIERIFIGCSLFRPNRCAMVASPGLKSLQYRLSR